MRTQPLASAIVLVGARLRLEGNDFAGARTLVQRARQMGLTLAQRQQAEELLAQIADRTGDVDGAIMARVRARLIAQQLRDMTGVQPPARNR